MIRNQRCMRVCAIFFLSFYKQIFLYYNFYCGVCTNSDSKMENIFSRMSSLVSLVVLSVNRSVSSHSFFFKFGMGVEINVLLPIQNDIVHQRCLELTLSTFGYVFFFWVHFHVKYLVSYSAAVWMMMLPMTAFLELSSFKRVKVGKGSSKKSRFYCITLKYGAILCVIINALYWWRCETTLCVCVCG